jgi:hypothetical protein
MQSGSDVINNIINTVTVAYRCIPPVPDPTQTASAKIKVLSLAKFTTDACFKPSSNPGPNISWSAPNATSCTITDPNGNNYVVGSAGTQKFSGGSGNYSIVCSSGSISVSGSLNATQCTPDYNMVPVTMCNGKSGSVTDNSFQPFGSGGQYRATVHVVSNPEQGFVSNLEYAFSKPGTWPAGVTSNWNNIVVNQPLYSADLILTATNLATVTNWLGGLPNKTEAFSISADTTPTPGNAKSASFTVCAPDGGSSKPIFIEQ